MTNSNKMDILLIDVVQQITQAQETCKFDWTLFFGPRHSMRQIINFSSKQNDRTRRKKTQLSQQSRKRFVH